MLSENDTEIVRNKNAGHQFIFRGKHLVTDKTNYKLISAYSLTISSATSVARSIPSTVTNS